jgi:formylglycine-generating enzyme required for sulfatase activity
MVVVPAGAFTLGSPASEVPRDGDEGPQHPVTIPRPFVVGRHEVTFVEWDACADDGGCGGYRPDDKGWGRGDRPAMYVNWDDAKSYAAWLSRKTEKTYRLLSEAEWEYAARAGTTTRYWWGDGIGRNLANWRGCGSPWDGKQTAPVGSFPVNGFGLHDMLGNVWE